MTMDNTLTQAGFKPMKRGDKRRLVVAVEGPDKVGKTHLSLTAPDPIAYFGLDVGHEGVVEKFLDDGKEIVTPDDNIKLPLQIGQTPKGEPTIDAAIPWENFKKAHIAACRSSYIKTVVWDTASEVWELIRMARFGKLSGILPRYYEPVNAEMQGMLRVIFDSDKNFIMLHRVKDEYVNDKYTGKKIREGFKKTGYVTQVSAVMDYDEDEREFVCLVKTCRQNMQIAGLELRGEMCSFPFLASFVFPDTDLEDWE